MIRSLISAFMMVALIGCSTTADVGNLLPSTGSAIQQQIGHDAAEQVSKLLPPALTLLELQHPHTDEFGIAFISALRAHGFAIMERDSHQLHESPSVDRGRIGTTQRQSLKYVLDGTGETNGLLISIYIGNRTITRPYIALNGRSKPAGYWVQKEQHNDQTK